MALGYKQIDKQTNTFDEKHLNNFRQVNFLSYIFNQYF